MGIELFAGKSGFLIFAGAFIGSVFGSLLMQAFLNCLHKRQ